MAVEYTYTFDPGKRYRQEMAATVQVSVYSYRNRMACGVLRTLSGMEEISFRGLDQAVLILEEILDRENLQVHTDGYRSLDGTPMHGSWLEIQKQAPEAGAQAEYVETEEDSIRPRLRSTPCSFLIRVYGRQNRSLQGELRTGGAACCFRSGMELMRLMHQRLQMEKITKREDRVSYGQRKW